MIPTTEMIPIRNRNDPVINFRNLGFNGLGTSLSILNSSFIHANTILNKMSPWLAAVTYKETSQLIKQAVPEIHEEGDEVRFGSFNR